MTALIGITLLFLGLATSSLGLAGEIEMSIEFENGDKYTLPANWVVTIAGLITMGTGVFLIMSA